MRFVIDATLEGRHEFLKERNIGVTVFGRETDYDTAQDAIVRNAAIEVRKRLAQYYLEQDHHGELRIDLPPGSYLPSFGTEPEPQPAPAGALRPRFRRLLLPIGAALAIAVAATAALIWGGRRTPASELEAFWEPLFHRRELVQICVGQPGRLYRFTGPRRDELDRLIQGRGNSVNPALKSPIESGELEWIAPDYLYQRDAFAAARIAGWIQSKGFPFQLLSVSRATYSQLRRSPLVAIGAFDNAWAMRINSDLRFVFDHKTVGGEVYNCITDRRNPNVSEWTVARSVGTNTAQDYAIVTRAFDPSTERTVMAAAGIESYGTLAAGEFVTDPEYLGAAALRLSPDWRRKNVQFVLGTKVIEGTPGPPQVLATHVW